MEEKKKNYHIQFDKVEGMQQKKAAVRPFVNRLAGKGTPETDFRHDKYGKTTFA